MKKFLLVCLCVIVGVFAIGGCSCGGDGGGNTNNSDSGWTDWH